MTDNTAFAAMVITGLIVGVIFGTNRICQQGRHCCRLGAGQGRTLGKAMTSPSDQDLRRMLAEATPIPWCGADCENGHLECREIGYIGHIELHSPGSPFVRSEAEKDARLIVAAVNALPAHLDEIARLKGEVEKLGRILSDLYRWADAYPISVFKEPDFAKAAKVLDEHGMTLDALSASTMRMMTGDLRERIRAAGADCIDAALAGRGGRKEGGE